MEKIIQRYEALTSGQKDMCKDGFRQAYDYVLTMLKKDEEEKIEMEDDLNKDPEIKAKCERFIKLRKENIILSDELNI